MVADTLQLRFDNFAVIKVAIPSLDEQRKIAAILSSVDDAIGFHLGDRGIAARAARDGT